MAGFSSVEMSCVIASPLAIERSRRRMILPLRVFGRLSPKRMSFGLAIGPISLATQSRSSLGDLLRLVAGRPRPLQHDEGADRLAGRLVGPADHRGLGDQRRCTTTSADSISIVPMRWPTTLSTSSMRPVIVK